MARGRSSGGGARAALGDYQTYPEGRPVFLPEAERYGNAPDLPSLLLQQRVIYISMPVSSGSGCLTLACCCLYGLPWHPHVFMSLRERRE